MRSWQATPPGGWGWRTESSWKIPGARRDGRLPPGAGAALLAGEPHGTAAVAAVHVVHHARRRSAGGDRWLLHERGTGGPHTGQDAGRGRRTILGEASLPRLG